MAVDITLKIYRDTAQGEWLARIPLYFGRSLQSSSWAGNNWVRDNGMRIVPPWESNAEGHTVTRAQLQRWIAEGFLTTHRDDTFLEKYGDELIYIISFDDWS